MRDPRRPRGRRARHPGERGLPGHDPVFLALEDKWYRQNNRMVGNRQFIVQDPDGYLLRFFQDLGRSPIQQMTMCRHRLIAAVVSRRVGRPRLWQTGVYRPRRASVAGDRAWTRAPSG
jgi:hypothetical protein